MGLIESALSFYSKVVNERFVSSVEDCVSVGGERSCIFTSVVTIWLMIFQRLDSGGSLSEALSYLRQGYLDSLLDIRSLRVRGKRISGNTGGYSRARERISVLRVEQVCDELSTALHETRSNSRTKHKNVFVIDGSTLRLSHTDSVLESYPQKVNQYGKAHYPLLRLGVITNAATGVVSRPAFGPCDGSKAVGELGLAQELLERLPEHSTVIGDRYYGNARLASQAQSLGHNVIVRLKASDAKRYIGIPKSRKGEVTTEWVSTRSRTGNEYRVTGRFIWYTLDRNGFRSEPLILFTTLPLPMKQIVELYALRWNVELDLRSLKSTLKMDMLHSKSPDMITKEIYLGFAAYNLVRHLTVVVARALRVTPREISFAGVLSRIQAAAAAILLPQQSLQNKNSLDCLLLHMQSLKLPKRKKARETEPRKVWPKGQVKIMTKTRTQERDFLNLPQPLATK